MQFTTQLGCRYFSQFLQKWINNAIYFDVLLTVHLSIFILVINQLDAQIFVLQ